MELSPRPVLIATSPYIPALLTLRSSEDVYVHETAVDAEGKLQPVQETPMAVVLTQLKELVLREGPPLAKGAQNTIRLSVIARALAIQFDSLTRFLEVQVPGFGLRKLFSLDIGDLLDVYQVGCLRACLGSLSLSPHAHLQISVLLAWLSSPHSPLLPSTCV